MRCQYGLVKKLVTSHASSRHARPPIDYRKFRIHRVGRLARHRGSDPQQRKLGPLFRPSTRYHVTLHHVTPYHVTHHHVTHYQSR